MIPEINLMLAAAFIHWECYAKMCSIYFPNSQLLLYYYTYMCFALIVTIYIIHFTRSPPWQPQSMQVITTTSSTITTSSSTTYANSVSPANHFICML